MCYIPFFGWIPAAFFLIVEKDKDIKWHAMQSVVLHTVMTGLFWIVVPLLKMTIILAPAALIVQGLTGLGFLILMLLGIVKVSQGEYFRLPWVEEVADKLIQKVKMGA